MILLVKLITKFSSSEEITLFLLIFQNFLTFEKNRINIETITYIIKFEFNSKVSLYRTYSSLFNYNCVSNLFYIISMIKY